VPNDPLSEILRHFQSTHFRDLAGTRVSVKVPLSERLINEFVATAIRPGGPVRDVAVHPLDGDAFSVRVAPRAALLPSVTLRLEIIGQPELPASPVLVLKMATMGGLFGMATAALPIANMLPRGVRLESDRILVDLRAIAAERGLSEMLGYVKRLRVNTVEGRVVLEANLAVD